MAQDQLALFNPRKYQGVLPQTGDLQPPTGEDTVLQTLPAYFAFLSSADYSKYTPADFTSDVKKFGGFVGTKKLTAITALDVQRWVGELRKILREKTVSRKLTALTNYFAWLVAEKAIPGNPAAAIQNTRVTSPLPDILYEEECRRLLTAASGDPRTYLLVLLLLETGLKKAELFMLKLTHFDLSNPYAPELWVKHVGKKIRKDRKSKLPAEIVPVFHEYVNRYSVSDLLFPYTPRFLELLLTATAKRAKIQKRVTAGILRDTCAVRQLKRGEGIELVLLRLGLSETTWEDARVKYEKLARAGI